eukprot:Colp12_sorted_trinity150504_noHs@21545
MIVPEGSEHGVCRSIVESQAKRIHELEAEVRRLKGEPEPVAPVLKPVAKPATRAPEPAQNVEPKGPERKASEDHISLAEARAMLQSKAASANTAHEVNHVAPKKGFVVQSEKCTLCSQTVYPLEKISVDGTVYHKACFRCEECKKMLSLGNYSAIAGKTYCKPHFKQLFKLKGNYDEGFGNEQHKKKWDN